MTKLQNSVQQYAGADTNFGRDAIFSSSRKPARGLDHMIRVGSNSQEKVKQANCSTLSGTLEIYRNNHGIGITSGSYGLTCGNSAMNWDNYGLRRSDGAEA